MAERPEHSKGGVYSRKGEEFDRDTRYIATRVKRTVDDGEDAVPVEPGRYRLIAARACPWANRTIIVRRLLGLEDVLSIGFCGPTHDARSWTFDLDPDGVDPVLRIPRLQDAYFARVPDYPKGITVPAIVEVATSEAPSWNEFTMVVTTLVPTAPESCCMVVMMALPSERSCIGSFERPLVIMVPTPRPWPRANST